MLMMFLHQKNSPIGTGIEQSLTSFYLTTAYKFNFFLRNYKSWHVNCSLDGVGLEGKPRLVESK